MLLPFLCRKVIPRVLSGAGVFVSDPQHILQRLLGLPALFIESVGVDVQRSAGLGMSQIGRHGAYIHSVGDLQAGAGVAQAMDGQLRGQAVFFENQHLIKTSEILI